MKFDRRSAFKLLLGTALASEIMPESIWGTRAVLDPEYFLAKRILNVTSPDDLVQFFVGANTTELMTVYTVFFPNVMNRYGSQLLRAIKAPIQDEIAAQNAKGVKINRHRLKALPAVVAAHLMYSVDECDRERLWGVILKGLKDKRREVKEIIIQNIITATGSTSESIDGLEINPELVKVIDRELILAVEDDPALLMPASLGLELLLKAKLISDRVGRVVPKEVDSVIHGTMSAQNGERFFLRKQAELYLGAFSSDDVKLGWLPPQNTECLMGASYFATSDRYPYKMKAYLKHLAVIRAHLFYTTYGIADFTVPASKSSPIDDSVVAAAKLIAFFNENNILSMLGGEARALNIPPTHREFYNFIKGGRLRGILNDQNSLGIDLSDYATLPDEARLKKLIPFQQYNEENILRNCLKDKTPDDCWSWSNIVIRAIRFGLFSAGTTLTIHKFDKFLKDLVHRSSLTDNQKKAGDQVVSEAEKGFKCIDSKEMDGLEEKVKNCGESFHQRHPRFF